MAAHLTTQVLTGDSIRTHLDALARLRIEVFREWPYLYDGSLEYERRYLEKYAACPQSVVVIALDGQAVVGASTGLPLIAADADFQKAFDGSGFAPAEVFYLGESVLLPAYRGRGSGHRFFDGREAQARHCGARYAAFCAIDRSSEDARRPADFRPLDGFWQKRGYVRHDTIQATFDWREVGQSVESSHTLRFWMKDLYDENT